MVSIRDIRAARLQEETFTHAEPLVRLEAREDRFERMTSDRVPSLQRLTEPGAPATRVWPSAQQVLAAPPTAMIKHYRDLGNAFIAGRRAHGDQWLQMPFAAYAPFVSDAVRETAKLRTDFDAWGHGEDAQLAEQVAANAKKLRAAGYPYLATNLLALQFGCVAELHDRETHARGDGEDTTMRDRASVALVRERTKRLQRMIDLAATGHLLGTASEQSQLARTKERLQALSDALWERGSADTSEGETYRQYRAAWSLNVSWMNQLERLPAGMLPELEPGLSAFLGVVFRTPIDSTTGHAKIDPSAWQALEQARPALDQDGAYTQGLDDTIQMLIAGSHVPMPMFGDIKRADIAAAFASRVAPMGVATAYVASERFGPAMFPLHDGAHALHAMQRTPLGSIEAWAHSEARPVRRTLVDLMKTIDRDDAPFFTTVHETYQPPSNDQRFAALIRRSRASEKP